MSTSSALNSLLSSSSSANTSSLDLSSLLTAATGSTSTGINVTSAVDAAIYAAQAPERQWQAEQSTLQSQISVLSGIQTAANGLVSDLLNLSDPLGALAARVVSSSDSSVVSGTALAGTSTGTHSVVVTQLATAASWYSPVIANANAPLGSSMLTITKADGTQTHFDLNLAANSTLSKLVSSINGASLGVTASIVQDASGSRLALLGGSTGKAADFSVSDDTSTSSVWTSAQLPSSETSLPGSTFQVQNGSAFANISVADGSDLKTVADQISASGVGVSATVVTDVSGSHLEISSTDGNQITVTADPTMNMRQAIAAQNASISVDGVPVQSATNTVIGAIAGLSLTLTGTTDASSPAVLKVSADTTRVGSAITQLITDYNSVISQVSQQFSFNIATRSQGVLGSDAVIRSFQSALLGSIGRSVPSTGSAGAISSLSSLGITMQDDGTLAIDNTTLSNILSTDSDGARDFFQGASSNGFATNMESELQVFTKSGVGLLSVDIGNLTQQYTQLQSDVNNFESGYIATQKTLLTTMYSKAEIALQSLPNTLKQIQAELGGNSGS